MPETTEKLPLIPRQMPKWFWPLVMVVCVSATAFAGTLCLTMLVRRNSEPVRMALKTAGADPRIAALGRPLAANWLILGDSKTIAGTDRCYWQFKAHGPRGECIIKMDATRPPGDAWRVDFLQAFIVGSDSDWLTLVGDPEHPPENFNAPKREDRKEDAQTKAQVAPTPAPEAAK